jgi:hypothetical protein
VTTNLLGNGWTTVNVGYAGSVQGIQGTFNIENPPSFVNPAGFYTTIHIDDSLDTATLTPTLGSFVNPADSEHNNDDWGTVHGLGQAADINYEYDDTASLSILTGAHTTTNVQTTGGIPTTINGHYV